MNSAVTAFGIPGSWEWILILVVALLLGLESAGGFDLLLKLMQGVAEVLAGIGIVMLPAFVRGRERAAEILARSLRLPTLVGVLLAVAAAVLLGRLLEFGDRG